MKDIQADSYRYEFVLGDLFFANIDSPRVQKGKVSVVLAAKETSRTFELSFWTDGIVWVPCNRCLDDVEQPVSSTDKLLVEFGYEYAEEEDNLIMIPEEEGEVNVARFIYEFIVLAIPMKHVHTSGKYSKATSNELSKHLRTIPDDEMDKDAFVPDEVGNELVSDDTETTVDPRWGELKEILDNN